MTKAAKLCLFGALTLLLSVPVLALEPGDAAPDFTLTALDGVEHSLSGYLADGKTVVLEWFNPVCPFIKRHHQQHATMNETFARYADKDVVWLAVNSSAPGKEGHGLELNRGHYKEWGMTFPLLIDEAGTVGRAYGAKTTPHMFVITAEGEVAYAGAIDNERGFGDLGTTNYVADALDAVLAGKAPTTASTDPYGCSVKYGK